MNRPTGQKRTKATNSSQSNSASHLSGISKEINTYRNPWHRANNGMYGPELFTTDAKPVQLGRYQRFHVIKSNADGGEVYDFVLNGVCITQRAGPATEAQIDACPYAQDTMRKLGFMP